MSVVLAILAMGQDEARLVPLLNEAPKTNMKSTFDKNKKLIVRGGSDAVRAKVFNMADAQRKELYKLIELDEDSQQHALIIQLYGQAGDKAPPKLVNRSFIITDNQVTFKLDLHLANGVNEDTLSKNIIHLLINEIGVRDHQFDPNTPLELRVNPWLTHGIREAIRWQTDKTDRDLYARLFEQQSIYPLDDLLNREDDNHSLEILDAAFQVSSGALMLALLEQPKGKKAIVNLLREASTYDGEQRILLTKNFPESTLSKNSLAKWWALQLSRMAQRPAEDLLTITMTETQLKQALIVVIKDKEGKIHRLDPDNYYRLNELKSQNIGHGVLNTYNAIALLQTRAFPSYRPLIGGYQQVLFSYLGEKEKKSIWTFFQFKKDEKVDPEQMLSALKREREIMSKLGERTTDYLNWYELEQPTSKGNEFKNYLEVKKDLDSFSETDGGHISRYLDDIEKLYEK